MIFHRKRLNIKRVLFSGLVALYLATWIWGIPAINTSITKNVISYYKRAIETKREVRPTHPRLRFGASYAVCPFIVVTHYEYQVAGLWGWGGFTIDVWYFTGSKTIFGLTKWIS